MVQFSTKKQQSWRGQDLVNLLKLDLEALAELYPEQNIANLKRRKQEHNKKLGDSMEHLPPPSQRNGKEDLSAFDELLKRSGVDAEDVASISRMNIYQSAKKGEDGEWDQIDQYAMQITPRKKDSDTPEAYKPVEAAHIRPTRRKTIQRAGKLILAYGDGQVGYRRRIDPVTDETELIPTHNIPMHNILKQMNAEYMPETTVNLGDFADFPELSRFDPDSDHFHKTLGMSMRYIHDFYAQFVADNPRGHHVEVDSNHAVRVSKQILKNIPALYDFVRPGEEEKHAMMTYYYLANLGKLGIDFKSGYGGAEFVYGEEYNAPPIIFKHGNHSSSSAGSTVRKESLQNPEVHVIRGHGHNDEEIRVTMRNGRQLIYKQFGSSCLNDGPTPGYASSVDDDNYPVNYHNKGHQNTFGMIEDHMNGNYSMHTIDVVDGKAIFHGKEYIG